MRQFVLLGLLSFLTILLILSCGGPSEGDLPTWERISKSGELIIGTDATYSPFEFVDTETGGLVGYDIDLMRRICDQLHLKANFMVVPFEGIIAGLNSEKYDAIISAMTITEERKQSIAFSTPYYDAGQTIAVRVENGDVSGPEDLKGKKVAVQMGTTGMHLAQSLPDVEVIPFDHIGAAFIDLENGQVDAVMNDLPVTLRAIRDKAGIKIVGDVLTDESYGIGVRQADSQLLANINAALAALTSSGFFDSLDAKWFGSTIDSLRAD